MKYISYSSVLLMVCLWLQGLEYAQTQERLEPSKKHTTFVGFTAWKRSTQSYEGLDLINMDGIIINEGDGFQPTFNRFICPTNATYFVTVTLKATDLSDLNIDVMKGSVPIMPPVNRWQYNPLNVVSNGVLVRCEQNETIYLRGDATGSLYGHLDVPNTLFTVMQMTSGTDQTAHVGASVWKGSHQNYTKGDLITYNNILSNENGSYNTNLSRFECPVNGIYFLMTTFLLYRSQPLQLIVEKDTVPILHVEDIRLENYQNNIGNSRLLRCSKGEEISVKANGLGSVYGNDILQHTTFTIMLIQETSVHKEKEQHTSFIGFSGWKKSSQSYDVGDTVSFDGIMIDEGEAYVPALNHFVCPVAGIYFISVNFKRVLGSGLQLDVERETSIVFRLTDVEDENPGNTLSGSSLIWCFQGDVIKVKASGPGAVYGDTSQTFTTFTVFLMYQY